MTEQKVTPPEMGLLESLVSRQPQTEEFADTLDRAAAGLRAWLENQSCGEAA